MEVQTQPLVSGTSSGALLYSEVPLSFWGGVEPSSGEIIDRHHPLSGETLQNRILAIPCCRGSCTGSMAMLELLLGGKGPAAMIFEKPEQVVTLGVLAAKVLFAAGIPVVVASSQHFRDLRHYSHAAISDRWLSAGMQPIPQDSVRHPGDEEARDEVHLSPYDESLLSQQHGEAARLAMQILCDYAKVQGAKSFVNVTQVHIDACIYTGPASVRFAEHFLEAGSARFKVPTSMNAISVDRRRWHELGMDREHVEQANRLADAFVKMGARPTFTCAPYLLDTAPRLGEHIGWAESNAVVFANSVLGACTQKYPDLIDLCIALTGRAPNFDCHLPQHRRPKVTVQIPSLEEFDESIYPILGYSIGELSGAEIPIVLGLEELDVKLSDLKAFGAAFATTSSAAMFHIRGITPEAKDGSAELNAEREVSLQKSDLLQTWKRLNTAEDQTLALVALGNPHFSLEEFVALCELCKGKKRHPNVYVTITTSREIGELVAKSELSEVLRHFGADVITDTCWCMLREPCVPSSGGNIMTNSGKYAHYAPGLVSKKVHFGSTRECVQAAVDGMRRDEVPRWLTEGSH